MDLVAMELPAGVLAGLFCGSRGFASAWVGIIDWMAPRARYRVDHSLDICRPNRYDRRHYA